MALLYLDGEDEITTAVGRIRSSDDAEVALVLPPGSRIGTSRINFRLLAREARDSDRHVVIVTLDAGVRSMAVAAGLPAFTSVAEYERGGQPAPVATGGEPGPGRASMAPPLAPPPMAARAAPSPTRSRSAPRLTAGRGLVVVFLVALVALAGAGAVFLLPSADITIVPNVEAIGPLNRTIVADTGALSADLATGVIPASEIALPLEASDTFPATGLKVVDTKATGKVTFTSNNTIGRFTIPAGSIVSTGSAIRFKTLAPVTTPKATVHGTTIVPGMASVRIEALEAGPASNVPADAISNIDTRPPNGDPSVLTVANTSATSGGTHTETKEVAQADVDAAMSTLQATLLAQLDAALAAPGTAPSGSTLIPSTAATGDP
ncbi:MAG: baseplate J/gp47 family protein, partial [Candidatus Limnocylindrales bacterium]